MTKFHIFILLAIIGLVVSVPAEGLRSSAVALDITPPIGVPLAGYGGRSQFPPDLDPDNYHTLLKPSEGVIDPLTAKIVVLESKGTRIAIVKLDSIGVSQFIVDDIVAQIKEETGIDRDHLTITGTHTHSGPGAIKITPMWAIAAVDLLHEEVYGDLINKLSNGIKQACQTLRPARIGLSTGLSFDLTKNRRDHPGVFDPVVAVFKIEDAVDGSPMAIMFNFAIHGTCYGSSNMKFSGDVMGQAERRIEQMMAEKKTPAVAMFINGCEGDVRPKKSSSKGVLEVGDGLAKKVLDVAPQITVRGDVDIAVINEEISFKKAHLNIDILNPGRFSHKGEIDCWGLMRNLKTWMPDLPEESPWKIKIEVTPIVGTKFRLQALRIGDAVIACVPGEPLTKFGDAIKLEGRKLGFENTFVFGLANGHMGYICDEDSFDEGGYEAMLNLYGRSAAEKMTAVYARMFDKLKKK